MALNPKLLFCLLLCVVVNINAESEIDSKHLSVESMCLAKLRQTLDHKGIAKRTLDGIVGIGWDDLTSMSTYPVFSSNFSECKTTPDGAYLIPNGVLAVPILKTRVDRMADYFKSFDEVKSGLKKTHSIGGSIGYNSFSIGGSYSEVYQETKTNIYEYQSSMFVSKLVHEAYIIVADVASNPLNLAFRTRLMEVADAINQNLPYRVQYLAEMIVKDFGTHVILKAKTGAMIEEQVYFDSNTTFTSKETLDAWRAEVSASFLGKISIGANAAVGREVTTEEKHKLSQSTRHSLTRSMGGPTVNHLLGGDGQNNSVFTVDTLVGFNYDGLYISELINANHFPNINKDMLLNLRTSIENAISEYYEMNTIRGCTDINAPNFNFQANVDDGSCTLNNNTYDFGGTFQICQPLPELPGSSYGESRGHPTDCRWTKSGLECAFITPNYRCNDFTQMNYFTGKASCPDGFEAVRVASVRHIFPDRWKTHKYEDCNFYLFFVRCRSPYWSTIYKDQVNITSYWCKKKQNVTLPPDAGVMFGGLYRNNSINMFTGQNGCPPTYVNYKLGDDVVVCLSRDYELGRKYAIPFGGFFSCQTPESHRHCPEGYSQHLATINDNCAIYVCVKTGAFRRFEPPLIKKPPFTYPMLAISNYTRSSLEYFNFGQLMMRIPVLDIARGLADKQRSQAARLLQPPEYHDVLPHSEVVKAVEEFITTPIEAVAKMAQTEKAYLKAIKYFDDIFSGNIPPPDVPKSTHNQKLAICLSACTIILNVSLLFALII